MKPDESQEKKLSRKKFLNTCSSVLTGGVIAGVSGVLLHRTTRRNSDGGAKTGVQHADANAATSPYKLTASFAVADGIEAFELWDDKIVVASSSSIGIHEQTGGLLKTFAKADNLRDMAISGGLLYLLYPAAIEVCDMEGNMLRRWKASSDRTDYCSIAVTDGAVFATDAGEKHICKYTAAGDFEKFIMSPNGFVIPSYSFGVACIGDMLYCSNSGRHQVEMFTLTGEYMGAFGQPGAATGHFCGCCNPVYLAATPSGEIITSEKGTPRIACYGSDGAYRSTLLDSHILASGNRACEVRVQGDRLFVASTNMVSTFKYDKMQSAACAGCAAGCPLRG